nr:hypothetical protein [Tanacetum cinerariifolium]
MFNVLRIAESDSDDEEEYVIKRNRFGALIYGLKPAPYLNCTNLEDRSSAIQTVTNPFRNINVWKKAVSFLGSLHVPLKLVNWKADYKGLYTKEEEATGQWRTDIRLTDPYENIYLQGFTTKKTDRKLSKPQEHTKEKPDRHDPNTQDNTKQWKRCCFHKFTTSSCYGKDVAKMLSLGCDGEIDDMLRIRVREARSDEEIFTYVAWIRAFNINEPIYAELCREFYSTYEFDEVHQNGYANVAWVIVKWMKRKGAGTQKESKICCGQFISKLVRKCRVLTEDVVRSLSALIYYRDLDTTTLRDLINSDGKLM